MKARNILLIITIFMLSISSSTQNKSNIAQVDEYLNQWHKADRFNGVVLIAKNDHILFEKGYGYANREWKVPCSKNMKFDIGSTSKQFTTVMIFQLIEEGKINLDDKLTVHLPDYRNDTGAKITIDNLLKQTSGIPCYIRDWTYTEAEFENEIPGPLRHHFKSQYLISRYMSGDLLFEPESAYHYSNSNHYLLGKIIENVTGKSFEQNLTERIIQPFNLLNTGLGNNEKIIPNMSSGYVNIPTDDAKAPYFYYPNFYGTGGMYSTVEDLYLWNRALETNQLLPESYHEILFTPYWEEGEVHSYLFNYYTTHISDDTNPVSYTSFSGAFDGFVTDVFRFPRTGHIIVIHDNSAHNNQWEIVPGIYRIINDQPVISPLKKASKYISNISLNNGLEAALEEYKNILFIKPNEYDFSTLEYDINYYANKYQKLQRLICAETLFQLNTELFPYSSDAWNGYGMLLSIENKDSLSNLAYAKAANIRNIEDDIVTLIKEKKYDEAGGKIIEIRKVYPDKIILSSPRIGPIFGEMFSAEMYDDALQICRLWILGNPVVPGPYFSMARVFIKQGNIEEAKLTYQKIIDIFPGQSAENAQVELEKLKENDEYQ